MRLELALNQRVYVKKNSKRMIIRGNRKFFVPSLNFELFHNRAIEEISKQLPNQSLPASPIFTGEVYIMTEFYLIGRTRVDGDGMHTSILDILQDARIISDDNNCIDGHYKKHKFSPDFKCKIIIEDKI